MNLSHVRHLLDQASQHLQSSRAVPPEMQRRHAGAREDIAQVLRDALPAAGSQQARQSEEGRADAQGARAR